MAKKKSLNKARCESWDIRVYTYGEGELWYISGCSISALSVCLYYHHLAHEQHRYRIANDSALSASVCLSVHVWACFQCDCHVTLWASGFSFTFTVLSANADNVLLVAPSKTITAPHTSYSRMTYIRVFIQMFILFSRTTTLYRFDSTFV